MLGDLPDDAVAVRLGDALAAPALLAQQGETFDLVFADPPYEDGEAPRAVLAALAAVPTLLAPDALVTIQHSRRVPLPEVSGSLRRQSERVYGDTQLSFYKVETE